MDRRLSVRIAEANQYENESKKRAQESDEMLGICKDNGRGEEQQEGYRVLGNPLSRQTSRAVSCGRKQAIQMMGRSACENTLNKGTLVVSFYRSQDLKQSDIKQSPRRPESSEATLGDFLVERKIKMLEDNAKFFEQQAHPLFEENFQLKDKLTSVNDVIRDQARLLLDVIRPKKFPDQSNRGLIENTGGFVEILACIKEDLAADQELIASLLEEKERLKQDASEKSVIIKELQEANEQVDSKITSLLQKKEELYSVSLKEKTAQISMLKEAAEQEKALKKLVEETAKSEIRSVESKLEALQKLYLRSENCWAKKVEEAVNKCQGVTDKADKEKIQFQVESELKVKNIQGAYENVIGEMITEYDKKVKKLETVVSETEMKVQELQETSERERKATKEKVGALQAEAKKFQLRLRAGVIRCEELEKLIENIEASKEDLVEKLSEAERQMEESLQDNVRLKEKLYVLSSDGGEAINIRDEKIKEYKRQLDVYDQQLKQQEIYTRDKLEENLERQEQELQKKFEASSSELRESEKKTKQQLRELQETTSVTIGFLEDQKDMWKRKCEQEVNELQTRLVKAEKQWSGKTAESSHHWEVQLKQMIEEKENDKKAAEQRREKEHQMQNVLHLKELEGVKEQNELEKETVRKQAQKALEEALLKAREEYVKMEQSKELEILMMKTDSRRQINELKAYHAAELDERKMTEAEHEKLIGNRIREQRSQEERGRQLEEEAVMQKRSFEVKVAIEAAMWKDRLSQAKSEGEKKLNEERIRSQELESDLTFVRCQSAMASKQSEKEAEKLNKRIEELEGSVAQLITEKSDLRAHLLEKKEILSEEVLKECIKCQVREMESQRCLEQERVTKKKMKQVYHKQSSADQIRSERLQEDYIKLKELLNEHVSQDDQLVNQLKAEITSLQKTKKEEELSVSQLKDFVRYLQMELNNYKANYDMFAPTRTTTVLASNTPIALSNPTINKHIPTFAMAFTQDDKEKVRKLPQTTPRLVPRPRAKSTATVYSSSSSNQQPLSSSQLPPLLKSDQNNLPLTLEPPPHRNNAHPQSIDLHHPPSSSSSSSQSQRFPSSSSIQPQLRDGQNITNNNRTPMSVISPPAPTASNQPIHEQQQLPRFINQFNNPSRSNSRSRAGSLSHRNEAYLDSNFTEIL